MTELSVDPVLVGALEQDELLFDTMHRSAENSNPPLGLVHAGLEATLARLDVSFGTVAALEIGFRTFEVVRSIRASGVSGEINDTLWQAFTQPEISNFPLDFLGQFYELEASIRRREPALAATAEQLACAYLATTRSDIGRHAVVGAALGWSVFDEVSFWRSLEESM